MTNQPRQKRVLVWCVVLLVLLPILAWLLLGAGALLGAMGDPDGRVLFIRLAAACGALWVVDLAGCVVALVLDALGQQRWPPLPAPDESDIQPQDELEPPSQS